MLGSGFYEGVRSKFDVLLLSMDSSMCNIFFAKVPICPSGFSEGLCFCCSKRGDWGNAIRVMFSMRRILKHESRWPAEYLKNSGPGRVEGIFSFYIMFGVTFQKGIGNCFKCDVLLA